jgi:hypothetical protein
LFLVSIYFARKDAKAQSLFAYFIITGCPSPDSFGSRCARVQQVSLERYCVKPEIAPSLDCARDDIIKFQIAQNDDLDVFVLTDTTRSDSFRRKLHFSIGFLDVLCDGRYRPIWLRAFFV